MPVQTTQQRHGSGSAAQTVSDPRFGASSDLHESLRQSNYEDGAAALAPEAGGPAAAPPATSLDRPDLAKLKQWCIQGYEVAGRPNANTRWGRHGRSQPRANQKMQSYQRGAFLMTLEMGADGPVLSFAGTDPTSASDLAADLNVVGVGFGQFADNATAVRNWLEAAHEATGQRVIVVGHSLGGAHAQWAASFFPEHVKHVYSVDAPAIAEEAVTKLDAHNENNPQKAIGSSHFVTDSAIAFNGERYTPGDLRWYSTGKHSTMIGDTHPVSMMPTDYNRVGGAQSTLDWEKQVLSQGLEGHRDLGGGIGLLVDLARTNVDVRRWAKLEGLSNPKASHMQNQMAAMRAVVGDRAEAVTGAGGAVASGVADAGSRAWNAASDAAGDAKDWVRDRLGF